ncbi:MAG: dihydroorotate dehydrogenase (quinone) [Betaproteobacteria bacterium RIFCSPLOWO2_02_64_14]|nr:MAG: dihydroorotate dehydrogenase (quinone) [Betaproteobacteria bacterium RIFCSPLOWO2_02_64_14]
MASLGYRVLRPFLRLVSPETAHRLAIGALKAGLSGRRREPDDPILTSRVWGLDFPNPVGLAAGFDKDAEVMGPMLALGFGFVEAGTVTPHPQPGNPRPRLFRLDEDEAVINRLGFNSRGLGPFAERLAKWRAGSARGIVGANVGKNRETQDAAADYVAGIEAMCGSADYLVCNVSSPNTPGLRSLQARVPIANLLQCALEARQRCAQDAARPPPLLAKVGPDLDEIQMRDIAEVALASGVDGLIVGNTTVTRPEGLRSRHAGETGGLSGRPLLSPSTACLAQMYRLTAGRLPIIGCGGIASGADAYAKIRAGATLVQLYSALVFQGPGLIAEIKRDLVHLLRADGFSSVADAIGADHRK